MFGIFKTLAATVVLAALMAPQTDARASGRSGEEVVHQVCAACHATGRNGAPKIGDDKAWQARAAQGLSSLTRHAISGIRNMPAHGGSKGVTDYELELAITYMVNQSGGHWAKPINKAAPPAERSGEEIVNETCVKCHGTGVGGAPRIGDRGAWIHRATYGIDALLRSAIAGHGAMPSRGGMPDLTDSELRRAIVYMLQKSVGPVNKASTTGGTSQAAPSGPVSQVGWNHKVVGSTEIYVGLLSAAELRASHPKPDATTAELGGIPSGSDAYYLNVSLFDRPSSAEIKGAKVKATVSDPVMGGEARQLESITFNNSVSYGSFIRIPRSSANAYIITLRISRPDMPGTIVAKFYYPH